MCLKRTEHTVSQWISGTFELQLKKSKINNIYRANFSIYFDQRVNFGDIFNREKKNLSGENSLVIISVFLRLGRESQTN